MTMLQHGLASLAVLMVSGISLAAESNPLPVGIPPMIGKAVAEATQRDDSKSGWTIALTLPRDTWREIHVAMPKLDWPEPNWEEVRPDFRDGTLTLPMGDHVKPTWCRVVDTSGKELGGDQVLTQLKSQMPVLVSASGKLPHACYLRLPTPAKLIVLLGPSDKQGVANPRKKKGSSTFFAATGAEWAEITVAFRHAVLTRMVIRLSSLASKNVRLPFFPPRRPVSLLRPPASSIRLAIQFFECSSKLARHCWKSECLLPP